MTTQLSGIYIRLRLFLLAFSLPSHPTHQYSSVRMADSRDFPDEFTITMLLLRLLTFLNHGFAVASQPPYRIDEAVPSEMPPLESAAALLVMDMQVLAACYRSAAQDRVVTATTVSD